MPELTKTQDVWMLQMGADENRFSPDWVREADAALDQVVADPAPLVTIGSGKFYSNGLDLDYVMANPESLTSYSAGVQRLLARVLTLPVPTVAAISGDAFGAGAMFAIAHDWRVMRADRGYFCFPEVDIHIPFTEGMAALIQTKLTPDAAVTAMTTGRRFAGPDAVAAGIAGATAPADELAALAIQMVDGLLGKDAATLGAIKSVMFTRAVVALRSA